MSRLLFVDDEPVILKSMVANDWGAIGIEQVYQATTGLEAVELIESLAIDIVVTDIRMPGMDGLQLCKYVQEHHPLTKCILLSGYGEFEYAKQAIVYGTANYLLKPVSDEELMAEVARVKMLQEQEWDRIGSFERARQTLHAHLPLLRSNLLGDLLGGMRLPQAVLAERMREYQLSFEPGAASTLMLVRLDDSASIHESSLYTFAVGNIAAELLGSQYEIWLYTDANGYLCLLMQNKNRTQPALAEESKQLEKLAHELILKVAAFLKGEISVLIGETRSFPGELVDQYRRSLNAFRKIPRSDRGIVVRSEEARTQSRSLDSLYAPPSFQQLLEARRWPEASQKLAALFEEMRAKKLDTEEHISEVVYTLMNAFLYLAHQQGKTLMELTGFEADIAAEQGVFSRLDHVMEWAEMALRNVTTAGGREFKDNKSQLISKIHRFIEDQIARDVSLQAIADHVGLHPAYLSSLYKQETKENISDFIMRYRMEKASVLLRTTDIKIYELSSMLGFQNPPYFSKLFKYHYRMTPNEYRERNQAES
ncbi:response regulator transcription factor [Paenibacillus daejeonensis]|uniref:response regulator transcription factor n=1 Tax=Paenibacillus daejeonensis TaxID=135193 RepID=UPI00037D1A83|nr:response regulator [Paenibacillus daejeonensis]